MTMALGLRRGGTHVIYQLLYTSDPSPSLSDDAFPCILEVSRKKNASSGITGLLVHSEYAFLQILEGARSDVLAKYDAIRNDPRHQNCDLVHEQQTSARSFPNWAMGARRILPGQPWCDGIDTVTSSTQLAQLVRGRSLMLRRLLSEFGIVHIDTDMYSVLGSHAHAQASLQ